DLQLLLLVRIGYHTLVVHFVVEVVHIVPESAVPEAVLEIVLLHLGECPISCPSVIGNSIDGGHSARAMTATTTGNKHRLIGGIIDKGQELIGSLGRGPRLVAHRNADEFHPRGFNQTFLIGIAVPLKVYYHLDAHCKQVLIVAT